MAESDIKQLNKTVEDAVKSMKIYMGNSAQIKDMNEKEREAIQKWFDVADDFGEQTKRQRAFSERARDENGKFLKKREESTNKFMNMAQTVGSVFTKAGRGLEKAAVGMFNGLKQNFSNLFGTLKSEFLGLFGEESELFGLLGSIKDSVTGFFGWFIRGFMFLFKKTPAWANKMIGRLDDMYNLNLKQMKMDFVEGTKKKKGGSKLLGALGVMLFMLAAGFAGWLSAKLMALQVIWKGFKITKIFNMLKMKTLGFFSKIGKWWTKLSKILTKVPILGKLLKGLKFGLKWLGWPITILLGIIDFIKGFANTEGSLFEKIKGGLWAALEGFIELPVQLIGWVVEKVAGLFGVEVNNISDKIMAGIQVAFDFLTDFNPLAPFIDFIEGFIGTEGTFWEKIKGGFAGAMSGLASRFEKWILPMMEAIQPIIAGVTNFFIDFWNSAIEWIQSKIPDWLPGSESIVKGLKSTEMSRIEPITATTKSPMDMYDDNLKARIDEKKKADAENEKNQKKIIDEQKTANDETKKQSAINSMSIQNQNNQGGGGGGAETQQIPDEVDNMGMIMFNFGGGMS